MNNTDYKLLGYAMKTHCNKCGYDYIGGLSLCALYCKRCGNKDVTVSKSKEHPVYGNAPCS